jgi:Rrf2 family nitric oxide-sensitive transcriptional repressor
MQLTKHTDFAFRALIFLASMKQDLATIQQIADRFKIPKSHLMKVINTLANQGYVKTVRGKNGGTKLAKEPHEISLKEIVVLMEKTLTAFDCVGMECVILRPCKLKRLLDEAQSAYLDYLDDYYLSDLIDDPTTQRLHFR